MLLNILYYKTDNSNIISMTTIYLLICLNDIDSIWYV